jgi:hypothetical protein
VIRCFRPQVTAMMALARFGDIDRRTQATEMRPLLKREASV